MLYCYNVPTHCVKKTLTVSCKPLGESGDRVKVDQSSFSADLHAVMLRHHCSEYDIDSHSIPLMISFNIAHLLSIRPYPGTPYSSFVKCVNDIAMFFSNLGNCIKLFN